MIKCSINPQVPHYGGATIYGFKPGGTPKEFESLLTDYLKLFIVGDTISSVFEDMKQYGWDVLIYG